jgi:hypothetical protein
LFPNLFHKPVVASFDQPDSSSGGGAILLKAFENAPSNKELLTIGCELADVVIEHHAKRLNGKARLITIDLDPTDDPTHGAQQLTFFNAHYDSYCYLPNVAMLKPSKE